MIIAVDGPSAAGKGTLARAIAKAMGYHFLDTGALYRMVGLEMLRIRKDDEVTAAHVAATLKPDEVDDAALRNEDVAAMASKVAAMPKVRAELLAFQRRYAARSPGAVLDGRDIGTVVCPDAAVKLYVTASAEVRAQRRFSELQGQVAFEQVLADIKARDDRDANRPIAPTKPADDAIIIDTSELNREQAFAAAMEIVRKSSG